MTTRISSSSPTSCTAQPPPPGPAPESSPHAEPLARRFAQVTNGPQAGDLRPVAGDAASRYHKPNCGTRRREGAGMAHIVVRIIELLVAIGLAAATPAIFVVALIAIVHGLRSAGRPR